MDPEPNQVPKASVEPAAPVGDARTTDPPSDRGAANDPAPPQKRVDASRTRPNAGTHPNNVRKLRQRAMMSKAELARRAGVSPLTIDRVESGCPCRMDTKRKILEALGLQPSKAEEVFPDVEMG
jgi:DNA-binding XRE family transcriptional regulator